MTHPPGSPGEPTTGGGGSTGPGRPSVATQPDPSNPHPQPTGPGNPWPPPARDAPGTGPVCAYHPDRPSAARYLCWPCYMQAYHSGTHTDHPLQRTDTRYRNDRPLVLIATPAEATALAQELAAGRVSRETACRLLGLIEVAA